jgi:NADPH:quinone reductase-like Zn-dependent oxidoreductase
VLIHAAAGGVGQAAISICQYLGAEIYTTTSKVRMDTGSVCMWLISIDVLMKS